MDTMSIEQICNSVESSYFDRKSARIDAKALAIHLIAFANADGGIIAIGVEDKGTITGINDYQENVNELLRASFDYCRPSITLESETISCNDPSGKPNQILLLYIPASNEMHANQADDVYLRIGDKSKKLNFNERLQLMYAKGTRYFEDEPVADSSLDDLDMEFLQSYCEKINYKKTPIDYIEQNKKFCIIHNNKKELSGAAVLLFSKDPQLFFPRARIRFVRYDGTEAKVGTEMNVIKDVSFNGRILEVITKSIEFVRSQIKERTFLGPDGKFITKSEYPEFAWKELIVNAVTHRDYSIKGTDIQIKMFDDRISVESPGTLPGIIRLNNIRNMHFSRNPKIAQFLHEYEYVQEFGEGVDRLFHEMQKAGLPVPEYSVDSFMLNVIIRNTVNEPQSEPHNEPHNEPQSEIYKTVTEKNEQRLISIIKNNPSISKKEIAQLLGLSDSTVKRLIASLKKSNFIEYVGSSKNGSWLVK